MQNEQLPEETQGLFETLKEFIDTLEESPDSESQVSGILTLLKSIIELSEADRKVSYSQNELLNNINESSQVNVKAVVELDQRITKLENIVIELASNSEKLAEQVKELAENAVNIPVINIDNLLKTLNEHSDEINENAASIEDIRDKLIL
jgi:methyl-accepting chemotaxis protein